MYQVRGVITAVAAAVLFSGLCLVACGSGNGTSSPPEMRSYKMGLVPMPRSFSSKDISDAYVLARAAGEVVAISQKLGWNTNTESDKYQDDVVFARLNQLEVFISMDVLDNDRTKIGNLPTGWESYDFSTATLRTAFKAEAKHILTTYSPDYLMLAIEINGYGNDAKFGDFVTLYLETYAELRSLDANVVMGVTFQYEDLLTKKNWSRISSFGTYLDRVCFTTYPEILSYSAVDSIPSNYYSPLVGTYKDVIFTEIGWSGSNTTNGEAEQLRFAQEFFSLTSKVDVDIAIWALLHDWTGGGFYEYMGLIGSDGVPKPSWTEWTRRKGLTLSQ